MIGQQASKKRQQLHQAGKMQLFHPQTCLEGFTIIESLLALVVVSILLVAIAPVITLSVATRVQARRVEIASQAARTYIDGVRTKAIEAPGSTNSDTLQSFSTPTPSGSLTCSANSYCDSAKNLYCVDFDGNGCSSGSPRDMVVQAFRYNSTSVDATKGYGLGVRVYRSDAFQGNAALSKNNSQATFTGGMGQSKAPLVEITTDINDTVPKYSDFCARIAGGCNN